MKQKKITLFASLIGLPLSSLSRKNPMDAFRPENRSHSHSYAPSFHDRNKFMRLDSGFNICY